MDSRTAAHVLSQIAAYLELKGESSFKCRAYAGAAQGLLALRADDLGPLYRSGELSAIRGLGPATLAVIRDLIETGESRYLEQLRESTPEGLLDMLDVPGLSPLKIHQIHEGLGIESVEELEAAANDGRLATLPKFGPKTIAKILKGIASARERGPLQLYHHARVEAQRLLAAVTSHPDVVRAEVAGAIRRRAEVASSIDIVAGCARNPTDVAQSFTRLSGVESAEGDGAFVSIRFVDGADLELHCVDPDRFALALWRATGTAAHVDAVRDALASNGVTIDDDRMRDGRGAVVAAPGESAIYAAASLAFVEPELREGLGEVDAARRGTLPILVSVSDIRGALHCHTHYSDGKASIGEMAQAARERGWSYLGITDHSQAAFFAGGLSREAVRAQQDEIDELNSTLDDFRLLKGIEADILAGGQLDYGDELLDEFDFVVGAIHSRFSMDRTAMTDRVLRALDDPRLTILAHPTGRLLLSREPYAIDLDAVLEKAAALGVAVELNADPRRLDLDWRHLRAAKRLGATVAIGPDAHSTRGLDNMEVGVGIARKGWLERGDVLNARSAADVVAFARARRGRAL
jgi:DNA polymerase (family 10)